MTEGTEGATGDRATGSKRPPKADARQAAPPRAWWITPLVGVAAVVLVLLTVFVVKACGEPRPAADADAATSAGGGDAAPGAGDDGADGDADSGDGEAGAGAADDGTTEAGAGGDDADAGGAADNATDDGETDRATATRGDAGAGDGSADLDGSSADANLDSGGGGAAGDGPVRPGGDGVAEPLGAVLEGALGGGSVDVTVGPGGGVKTGAHRTHYGDNAVRWRISAGNEKISRTEQRADRFDVWLSPGESFEGVRVEWQDVVGRWHAH